MTVQLKSLDRSSSHILDDVWDIVKRESSYEGLGRILDDLGEIPHLVDPEELHVMLGSIRHRRAELALAADIFYDGHHLFPHNNLFAYEAALLALDANRCRRAQQMIRVLEERIDTLTERQLRGMWRGGALAGLHRSARRAFDVARLADSEFATDHVGERLLTAIHNQALASRNTVRLVSLGSNCFPWMVLNRWGLRANPAADHENSVFNLVQCGPYTATLFMQAPDALVSPDALSIWHDDNGAPTPFHERFGIMFNHEVGEIWAKDNFFMLTRVYSIRLENFRKALSGGPRVFVYYVEQDLNLQHLVNVLEECNRDQNYLLVIIDPRAEPTPNQISGQKVRHLRLPFPMKNYTWHVPDHFDSLGGTVFERTIADFVMAAMTELASGT